MTMERQALGKTGEDLAVAELERRGYAILARRYRTRHGEIDIVARDGERHGVRRGQGAGNRRVRQRRRGGHASEAAAAQSMAVDYLARHRLLDRPCRFDVVAIDGIGEKAVITVYRVGIPGARERVAALIGQRALWYDCHFRTVVWPSLVMAGGPGERE